MLSVNVFRVSKKKKKRVSKIKSVNVSFTFFITIVLTKDRMSISIILALLKLEKTKLYIRLVYTSIFTVVYTFYTQIIDMYIRINKQHVICASSIR